MKVRRREFLSFFIATAGMVGIGVVPVTASTSVTTTFSLTVQVQSIGLAVSAPQTSLTSFDTKTSNSSESVVVQVYNSGNQSGEVTAQLGVPPQGLTYVSAVPSITPPPMANQLYVYAQQDDGGSQWLSPGQKVDLSKDPSQPSVIGKLGAGGTGNVDVGFTLSQGTAAGTYQVPAYWNMQ